MQNLLENTMRIRPLSFSEFKFQTNVFLFGFEHYNFIMDRSGKVHIDSFQCLEFSKDDTYCKISPLSDICDSDSYIEVPGVLNYGMNITVNQREQKIYPILPLDECESDYTYDDEDEYYMTKQDVIDEYLVLRKRGIWL